MKGVAIACTKGGVGKTTLSHLLALGAAWRGVPAYLMHTDERDPISVMGRPYLYYDARSPETLATLMGAAINEDGLCVIDSGGNRADFDMWIADSVDLVLIPVTPDPEAITMATEHMERLRGAGATNVRFIMNMVSSNRFEKISDVKDYFSKLDTSLVIGEVGRVAAVKKLRLADTTTFQTPSTPVNNLARQFYRLVSNELVKADTRNLERNVDLEIA